MSARTKSKLSKSKLSIYLSTPSTHFIQLVQYSVPYPHEYAYYAEALMALGWERIVGGWRYGDKNSHIAFFAHLDVACNNITRNVISAVGGQLVTAHPNILGADDRAGVAIILFLAHCAHKRAQYFLWEGEEMFSAGLSSFLDAGGGKELSRIKICVSLDRRGYTDFIDTMCSEKVCSDEFAQAFCEHLRKQGMMYLPASGTFTDSYHVRYLVPEVCNLSVGYFNSHTPAEIQDLDFLDRLGDALASIDLEQLPIVRKPDQFYYSRFNDYDDFDNYDYDDFDNSFNKKALKKFRR